MTKVEPESDQDKPDVTVVFGNGHPPTRRDAALSARRRRSVGIVNIDELGERLNRAIHIPHFK